MFRSDRRIVANQEKEDLSRESELYQVPGEVQGQVDDYLGTLTEHSEIDLR